LVVEGEKRIIAIIGAGGTAGNKVSEKLSLVGNYDLRLCEKGEGIAKLKRMGLTPTDVERAVPESAYLREVTLRDDCSFVVAHPCHPPLFGKQDTAEAYNDFFGGIAKQDIVIALLHGNEEDFKAAEKICMDGFAPVARCHRITVDQMAVLEPIAAEVVAGSAAALMKEAFEEAVRLGVPEEAARAFMLGHMSIILAIFFGRTEHKISEAAIAAIRYGRGRIFKDDWQEIFKDWEMRKIIHDILHDKG